MRAWKANDLLPIDVERYAKSSAISENMEHQAFLAAIRAEIATFLEAFPEILFAVLYGSAVEGMAFRDLDIALWLDRSQVPAEGDLEFEFRIESELRKRLSVVVDVRVVNDAPLLFRYHVSCGIPLLV
ncbi:MAG: hypothetical protein ACK44E_08450, partial [Anaerolineales bacterium]